jgi:CRISPR-associated protein Csm2
MSNRDRSSGGSGSSPSTVSPEDVRKIIETDNAGLLVQKANIIGEQIARAKLTTSQIRNVYGPVRQIESTWPTGGSEEDRRQAGKAFREVVLLKPKLSYLAAREPKLAVLETHLSAAIDAIGEATDEQERHIRFQRFVDFFEAILAYHKSTETKLAEQRRHGSR